MAPKPKFKIGDPVWTKMKGYCPWPSRIADPAETSNLPKPRAPKTTQHLVYFFGSNNFAWMTEETIVPFLQSKEKHKKGCKKASFKKGCIQIEEYVIENNFVGDSEGEAHTAAIKNNDSSNDNAASPADIEDNNLTIDESCNAVDTVDEDVVAKLKEKVAMKIKEKEAKKIELKEMKLSTKVSLKLKVINNHLDKFSKASEEVAIAKSADQINAKDFNAAVQTFQGATLPKLGKCLGYFMKDNQKISTLRNNNECRVCHSTLTDIIQHLKDAKISTQVPDAIKIQVKKCLKGLREQSNVKAFANLEIKEISNAMIERKENDAES